MLGELKKLSTCFAIFAICMLLTIPTAVALNEPPATGGSLPPFELPAPEDTAVKSYLGLSDNAKFTVPQIKAQAVIIEIFSMY